MISESNDETSFRYKLLLTDRSVSKPCKPFGNNSSVDIKVFQTHISGYLKKKKQSGGFVDRFLGLLLKTSLPSMKNLLTPLPKSVLISWGLTLSASSDDATIQKKTHGSGTTLIILNKEMEDIMNVVKSLEESGLLMKDVSKTIENEAKE